MKWKLLDMREMEDGKRKFLIKWKGWGPKWNNWEPEENILDRSLLTKFSKKKRTSEVASHDLNEFPMHSKRRCAKEAAVKARIAAMREQDEGEDH